METNGRIPQLFLIVAKLLSGIRANIECQNATTLFRHDQAKIQCTSEQSFAKASWYHQGEKVEDLETKITGDTATLIFDPADVTTRTGEYRCSLLNKAEDVVNSGTAYLNAGPVPYKLRLLSVDGNHTYHQQSVTGRERSSTSIFCTVNAFPPATIAWYRDGVLIEDLPNNNRYNMENKHELEISDLQMQDRTTFTCIATNFVGNCTIITMVRVRSWMAPIWPAIGIALELSILGAYILFNRRVKLREAKIESANSSPEVLDSSTPTEERHQPGTSGLTSVIKRIKSNDDK